ncbi:MAG: hypothetical protein ACT6UH_00635 [Hydrogenophaga sp.]|uniref:hypothetical protein n=1 Tax=Hydrogenophaga sp. TaxID=1904254 RepID=UPI004035DF7D
MKTKLIALAALTAAAYPALVSDVAQGASFEAPTDLAEQLLGEQKAKLADLAPAVKRVKTVKARVLTVCEYGSANDLVEISEDLVKQAEKDGLIDTDKGAVAYAAGLEQNQPKPKAKT